jgi:hypothetical protein
MSNGSPVATIFVNFWSVLDHLWVEECIGKLRRLGMLKSFLNWINVWRIDRRAFVEIKEEKSR